MVSGNSLVGEHKAEIFMCWGGLLAWCSSFSFDEKTVTVRTSAIGQARNPPFRLLQLMGGCLLPVDPSRIHNYDRLAGLLR